MHPRTLNRWRSETQFESGVVGLTDEYLDTFVLNNKQKNRGEVYIDGLLRASGYSVPRAQLRASIDRVDREGREQRKQRAVKRRVYNVAGPHHMWHCDGHHKLVKYGLVTHGCIDGFSRAILYVSCHDNNRSETAFRLFADAVKQHTIPSRVRSDKGGENVLIADFMIQQRGLNRRSFIAGQSKHNTRIERLWRDMRSEVIEFYQILFRSFEADGMDTDNDVHLYCLQFMFMGRINEDLMQFTLAWNQHKLSTERFKTPLQLIHDNTHLFPDPVNVDDDDDVVEENDFNEPVPSVQVEPAKCPMTPTQLQYFVSKCVRLTKDDKDDTLYDSYVAVVDFAYHVIGAVV